MKVFIDPGHGGKDPGAVGNNIKEKDINLSVALNIGEILKRHNIEVIYSRTTDVFIELSDRAVMANRSNADVFVSMHCNSHGSNAKGVETFSHANSSKGAVLAKYIQDSIIAGKTFTLNRGIKKANFAVLRQTKMPAVLTELAFISNAEDAKILKDKQNELSIAVAKGILNYLGIRYVGKIQHTQGFLILSNTKITVGQMQQWARNKGANQLFIDLAPLFYNISNKAGVNPLATYCQSAKETGCMKFGGVLNATFNNPCGLKTNAGGGDKDPNAHKRFKSWEEGIQAQVDHLALYAGAIDYPKKDTSDPRHFPYLKGTATTVESLGGKWAPSKTYGTDIVKMIKEI